MRCHSYPLNHHAVQAREIFRLGVGQQYGLLYKTAAFSRLSYSRNGASTTRSQKFGGWNSGTYRSRMSRIKELDADRGWLRTTSAQVLKKASLNLNLGKAVTTASTSAFLIFEKSGAITSALAPSPTSAITACRQGRHGSFSRHHGAFPVRRWRNAVLERNQGSLQTP